MNGNHVRADGPEGSLSPRTTTELSLRRRPFVLRLHDVHCHSSSQDSRRHGSIFAYAGEYPLVTKWVSPLLLQASQHGSGNACPWRITQAGRSPLSKGDDLTRSEGTLSGSRGRGDQEAPCEGVRKPDDHIGLGRSSRANKNGEVAIAHHPHLVGVGRSGVGDPQLNAVPDR